MSLLKVTDYHSPDRNMKTRKISILYRLIVFYLAQFKHNGKRVAISMFGDILELGVYSNNDGYGTHFNLGFRIMNHEITLRLTKWKDFRA